MNINDVDVFKFTKDKDGSYLQHIASLAKHAQTWSYHFSLTLRDGTEENYVATIYRSLEHSTRLPFTVTVDKPFLCNVSYHDTLNEGYRTHREAFHDLITSFKMAQKKYKEI
jgi:hypothetical protein